jgi:hypothetical protein
MSEIPPPSYQEAMATRPEFDFTQIADDYVTYPHQCPDVQSNSNKTSRLA